MSLLNQALVRFFSGACLSLSAARLIMHLIEPPGQSTQPVLMLLKSLSFILQLTWSIILFHYHWIDLGLLFRNTRLNSLHLLVESLILSPQFIIFIARCHELGTNMSHLTWDSLLLLVNVCFLLTEIAHCVVSLLLICQILLWNKGLKFTKFAWLSGLCDLLLFVNLFNVLTIFHNWLTDLF